MRTRGWKDQRAVWLTALAVMLFVPRAGVAQFGAGDEFTTSGASCEGLKLKAATGVVAATGGVVGTKHSYSFVGTCFDGAKTFPAVARVEWDRASFSLKEEFGILGTFVNSAGKSYSGGVQSLFKCNEDPLVVPQAACNGVSHNNQTGAKFLSRPYLEQHRPITKGKTTLAEAKERFRPLQRRQQSPTSSGCRGPPAGH